MNPYRLDFDILGAAHPNFPLKMVANNLPNPCGIGLFAWPVFGDKKQFKDALQLLLETKKVRLVRIQAWWDDHKATPPLDSRLVPIDHLKKVARMLQNFSETYPRVDFYLSHTCEYYSKNKKAVLERIRVIKDFAPNVTPVNSPINGVVAGRGVVEERHGNITMGHGQGVSLDGKDATDLDVQRWLNSTKAAAYKFLWIHSFNFREKGKTPPSRPERTVKVTKQEMEWLCSFKG